ncbi:hypothetical protein KKF91_08165, partial [Myxococcota bacterium]|nr:hypothetical protein [Myxococcota bacterium]
LLCADGTARFPLWESRSPPEIYQSPAGSLSAGLFLFRRFEGDQLSATTPWFWRVGRRQKSIKAPQVLYLRGFFYVQNRLKATNSQQPRRGFGE